MYYGVFMSVFFSAFFYMPAYPNSNYILLTTQNFDIIHTVGSSKMIFNKGQATSSSK